MKDGVIKRANLIVTAVWLLTGIAALYTSPSLAGETLARVRANNEVRCGVTEQIPGFSYKDEAGRWKGFNVDFCRAVAAAVLGGPEKVSFTPLTAPNRFPILLSRKIDLLAHTVTWTFGREAGIGIDFPGIYFYDGQTFAVPAEKEIKRLEDLNGMAICVEKGTTFQANMADTFKKRGIPYTPVVVDSQEELIASLRARKCQACTAERSVVPALKAAAFQGSRFKIISGEISREPLAPAVRRGDDEWTTVSAGCCLRSLRLRSAGSPWQMCGPCRKKQLIRSSSGFSTPAASAENPSA